MPKLLREPKQAKKLDRVRIAAFKFQDNVFQGERWIEVWVVLGVVEDGQFQQYVDPETGEEVYQYIKLEDGAHPLAPGTALEGYDGARRFILGNHGSTLTYSAFKEALYDFLANEEVPHPVTGEAVKVLDITPEA